MASEAGKGSASRCRELKATRCGLIFCLGFLERRPCSKRLLVPMRLTDLRKSPACLAAEILRIADADEFCSRLLTDDPGWKRNGSNKRFQTAWRSVYDQAFDFTTKDLIEVICHRFVVPVALQGDVRIEIDEALLPEGAKIGPRDRIKFFARGHWASRTRGLIAPKEIGHDLIVAL